MRNSLRWIKLLSGFCILFRQLNCYATSIRHVSNRVHSWVRLKRWKTVVIGMKYFWWILPNRAALSARQICIVDLQLLVELFIPQIIENLSFLKNTLLFLPRCWLNGRAEHLFLELLNHYSFWFSRVNYVITLILSNLTHI